MQGYAAELSGLDQTAFALCLNERTTLERLQAADAEQRKRGIRSQPIFEIGERRLVGFQSVEALSAALDRALG